MEFFKDLCSCFPAQSKYRKTHGSVKLQQSFEISSQPQKSNSTTSQDTDQIELIIENIKFDGKQSCQNNQNQNCKASNLQNEESTESKATQENEYSNRSGKRSCQSESLETNKIEVQLQSDLSDNALKHWQQKGENFVKIEKVWQKQGDEEVQDIIHLEENSAIQASQDPRLSFTVVKINLPLKNLSFSSAFSSPKQNGNQNSSQESSKSSMFLTTNASSNLDSSEILMSLQEISSIIKQQDPNTRFQLENQIIQQLIKQSQKTKCYLEYHWAHRYTLYIQGKYNFPLPPINNTQLLDSTGKLNPQLKPNYHYVLITENSWLLLQDLYKGGPEIVYAPLQHDHSRDRFREHSHKSITPQRSLSQQPVSSSQISPLQNPNQKCEISDYARQLSILPIGLQNKSFYCYMNSVLQCLISIPELNYYFYSERYLKNDHKTKKPLKFCLSFSEIIKKMNKHKIGDVINPSNIKNFIKKYFNSSIQHDAQEFLRFLLSEFQDELNVVRQKLTRMLSFKDSDSALQQYFKYNVSIVDKLFAGQLESQITCLSCNQLSSSYDPFLDLSLQMPKHKDSSLQNSLQQFFSEEDLEDKYTCEKCKAKVSAKRIFYLRKLPKILVLHLKRFKLYPSKQKLNSFVKFPIKNLDISPYVVQDPSCIDKIKVKYNLQSIIMHSGSFEGGHYQTCARRTNKWYSFNDETIREVSESSLLKKEVYIFFYERQDSQNSEIVQPIQEKKK